MTKFLDITVIIPCYQAQNTLIDTLNCIPKELSIICVDDGSTDNTSEILKKWKWWEVKTLREFAELGNWGNWGSLGN